MKKQRLSQLINMALIGFETGAILLLLGDLTQYVLLDPEGANLFEIIYGVIAVILSLIIFYESNKKFYPLTDWQYQGNLLVFEVSFFVGIFIAKIIIDLFI
ncbi:hypothetical protein AKUG0406_14800 [Apilactobacillus kunkeei]|uniref:Uncharacterized protein n=2 Tax=Apilactobacillus kunkeei TaxID=148814 RepID=A0AAC8ZYS0_9LACO|nr:hypothetical protein [Apilactobacillus kunkeei]ALJ31247.1 hypothetical protein APS55_02935 [Apilactobacillus kunkeei]KDB01143.1 hypothetical protein LAKU_6c00010 [Apilactobacillus kunkeei EFB6]KFJ14770.1 hypothetical protein JI66_06410 [Apilactobacillus kunkeei]KOY70858.1 hypothetical protein RZ55_04310 [Apilactobacillus kunkeei]KOY71878.1 hypothetical protein RZ54_04870 [Apilactobacillus kunkeei]